MKLKDHALLSSLLLTLYPIFETRIFIAIAASIAIDIDHLYLIIKERVFSLRKIRYLANNIHKIYSKDPENAFKSTFYIFHTVEFNVLLFILFYNNPIIQLIILGFVFHIVSDLIHCVWIKMPILRWLFFAQFVKVNRIKK